MQVAAVYWITHNVAQKLCGYTEEDNENAPVGFLWTWQHVCSLCVAEAVDARCVGWQLWLGFLQQYAAQE
jgi:hypothetical protein